MDSYKDLIAKTAPTRELGMRKKRGIAKHNIIRNRIKVLYHIKGKIEQYDDY